MHATEPSTRGEPLVVDRYAIYDAIASGGMATVHLGRLIGTAGFLRTVAIKRLHGQYANDPDFTAMFLDEARLASRIQHPNVVSTLDVVMKDRELLLVMEYVRGESLSRLVRRARERNVRLPPPVVVSILSGALNGLHAAHDALDEKGQPLNLVHRDVSPQNVLVGADGVARVLDFGVAKAAGRVHTTREGDIKGKVLYMPPEQLAAEALTRTADVYAAGVVLFETLTSVRMFAGENETAALTKIITNDIRVPSEIDPELSVFDAIVRKATARLATDRYATAREMARELELLCGPAASVAEVSDWVQQLAGETLDERARIVAEIERSSTRSKPPLPSSGSLLAHTPLEPTVSAVSPVSVPSHVQATVPVATPEAAKKSLAPVWIALLAFMLLGCLGVIAVLLTRTPPPHAPSERAASKAAPEEPSPSATAAIVQRPAASAEAPVASATPSATASATPIASTARSAPAPRPRAAVNCDPPWVVDKNGHRHFIPECMK
ncbi:MAG: protein kinase [Labilithrix sp.]|nr:protein kinase [Labilithrix sp.]